jgi:hypothetical protein
MFWPLFRPNHVFKIIIAPNTSVGNKCPWHPHSFACRCEQELLNHRANAYSCYSEAVLLEILFQLDIVPWTVGEPSQTDTSCRYGSGYCFRICVLGKCSDVCEWTRCAWGNRERYREVRGRVRKRQRQRYWEGEGERESCVWTWAKCLMVLLTSETTWLEIMLHILCLASRGRAAWRAWQRRGCASVSLRGDIAKLSWDGFIRSNAIVSQLGGANCFRKANKCLDSWFDKKVWNVLRNKQIRYFLASN